MRAGVGNSSDRQGAARIASISAGGTCSRPIRRLSDSAKITRAVSKRRSVFQMPLSKAFCVGCGWSGRSPSTEPRCAASRSRSSTWAPAAANACSSRLLPLPVGPQTMRSDSRGGRCQAKSGRAGYTFQSVKNRRKQRSLSLAIHRLIWFSIYLLIVATSQS